MHPLFVGPAFIIVMILATWRPVIGHAVATILATADPKGVMSVGSSSSYSRNSDTTFRRLLSILKLLSDCQLRDF